MVKRVEIGQRHEALLESNAEYNDVSAELFPLARPEACRQNLYGLFCATTQTWAVPFICMQYFMAHLASDQNPMGRPMTQEEFIGANLTAGTYGGDIQLQVRAIGPFVLS